MSDSNEGSLPVTLNVIGDDVPNTELLEVCAFNFKWLYFKYM